MGRMMSATDARIHFGELMRRVVEGQEPVIVERGGKPHVVVISVDEYERLLKARREQEDWHDLVRRARKRVRADLGGRDLMSSEDVLRQVREDRDGELVALR